MAIENIVMENGETLTIKVINDKTEIGYEYLVITTKGKGIQISKSSNALVSVDDKNIIITQNYNREEL